jgi:hypothetical protein
MLLQSGDERFTVDVATAWTSAAGLDWSVGAGTVEWSCAKTADHAVDCVYAPAFFLASRKLDGYPDAGGDLTMGEARATPERLVESLRIATRIVAGVVNDAGDDVRAVIFRRPEVVTAGRDDFPPRAAMELILHAHDVCAGLGVAFEPSAELAFRLREHTRPWPMWSIEGGWSLDRTEDPWGDLLSGAGRARTDPAQR